MKLYTAEELAEILKVKKQTIYKWGRYGKLERIKVGGSVRFTMPQAERRLFNGN